MSRLKSAVTLASALQKFYLPACSRALEQSQNNVIREDNNSKSESQFDERFFQALWNEQFFKNDLRLKDGRNMKVISPGTWNLEEGPDFKRATVLIDGTKYVGDIEIHRKEAEWNHHGHYGDDRYNSVILHAVWTASVTDNAENLPPCFVMADNLDRPWPVVRSEIKLDTDYPYARKVGPGRCSNYLRRWDNESIRNILRIAGLARFREKASRIQQRVVAVGSEQAVYESIFEALGYKANKVNMRTLARHVPLSSVCKLDTFEKFSAAFFGAAGLLPDTTRKHLDRHMQQLVTEWWDLWWPLGISVVEIPWKDGGGRPYNSPFRRLAAGCTLLWRWNCKPGDKIMTLAREAEDYRQLLYKVREELRFDSDWEGYADFDKPLNKPAKLLGKARIRDIIVNVILPYIWARAESYGEEKLKVLAEHVYLGLPKLQSNRMTIEAGHRFFVPPSRLKELAKGAAEQQGMISLYRDFCLQLGGNCGACPLSTPELFEKVDSL